MFLFRRSVSAAGEFFLKIVRGSECVDCGNCRRVCPTPDKCTGCGLCVEQCPVGALRVEYDDEEKALLHEVVGWHEVPGEYKANAYEPGVQEAELMKEVLDAYREMDCELAQVFDGYVREENIALEEGQRDSLLKALKAEAHGYSAIDSMVKDPGLEEITVAKGRVRVYGRGRGWLDANVEFTNPEKVVALINRMARPLGRRVTLKQPRVNALLPDGSRLHAAIPPVVEEPCLTIRKFLETPLTPEDLVRGEVIDEEGMFILKEAVKQECNIMIAGSTGSGKTTTLNALCTLIPKDQRIIIVEETPEISVPHEHCVRLVVNTDLGITMHSLVGDTLRMRPDKLVVGEVRDEKEVKALMDTMLAGQGKGSLCTFHALSAREAIARLRALGAREADLNALHCIAVQKRLADKGKEVRAITEIAGFIDGELKVVWRKK